MRHLLIITTLFVGLSAFGQARDISRTGRMREQKQDKKEQKQDRPDKQERRNERMLENVKANRIPDRLNQIKIIKTAYMTKRLELTPDQSAKFWPLYNHYQEEIFLLNRQIKLNNSPMQNNGKDQIYNKLALDEKKISIEKNYANEFLKIMPAEKLSLLYKSERDFNDEAVKRLKEGRNETNN